MRWQTGIVMEVSEKHVVVMTPVGEFKRIRIKGRIPDIGDEIRVPAQNNLFTNLNNKRWLAVAAMIIMFAIASPLLLIITQPPEVAVAYVAIDINPSVELTVSNRDNVLDVKAYNQDGAEVLAGLNIKGTNYRKAVSQIGRKAIELGFISKDNKNTFVISMSPISNAKFDKAAMEKTLLASANEVLVDSRVNGEFKTIKVPVGLRERAVQKGISPAKYAVLLEAVTAGIPVTEKDMQEKSIALAIAGAGGEPEQIINQAHAENSFEDKEKKYFAILSSTIAMEEKNEVKPAAEEEVVKPNEVSVAISGDAEKPPKSKKPLIEPVRKNPDPEAPKEGTNSITENSGTVTVQPQVPVSTAPAITSQPNVPGDGDTIFDESTEKNYMGTPVEQGNNPGSSQEMYRLKPNF